MNPTEIKKYIDQSILCWLATVSKDGIPNVSPKECFTYYGDKHIIIGNIASPQTVKNIQSNSNVCISFIDILVQKGFQIKGQGQIIDESNDKFKKYYPLIHKLTCGKFPFATITEISIDQVKPIVAPSYILYPETTEEEQIESAKKAYSL